MVLRTALWVSPHENEESRLLAHELRPDHARLLLRFSLT